MRCPICRSRSCRWCRKCAEVILEYSKEAVARVSRHLRMGWTCFVCGGGMDICRECWDVIYELKELDEETLWRAGLCVLRGIPVEDDACAVCQRADETLCPKCEQLVERLVLMGKERTVRLLAALRRRCVVCGEQAPPAAPFCEHCYRLAMVLRDPAGRRALRYLRRQRWYQQRP